MKHSPQEENWNFIQDQKSNENIFKLSEDDEEYEEIVPLKLGNIDLDNNIK